jgi:hypothetical protein
MMEVSGPLTATLSLGSRGYVYYEESSAKEAELAGRAGQLEDTEVRWSSSLHLQPVYRGSYLHTHVFNYTVSLIYGFSYVYNLPRCKICMSCKMKLNVTFVSQQKPHAIENLYLQLEV